MNIECFELFINHKKAISKNAKLAQINAMLKRFDEDKIENIYKIITAFIDKKTILN